VLERKDKFCASTHCAVNIENSTQKRNKSYQTKTKAFIILVVLRRSV